MNSIYRNDKINLVVNLEKHTLIAAPTRWGKTFELAKIARWALKNGYFPIFLTSNLTSLSADWNDKHTTLNEEENEIFETVILNNKGNGSFTRTMLSHQQSPPPIIYGTHRYSAWVKQFASVLHLAKLQWKIKPVILCDEVHGTETASITNDYYRELAKVAPVIGVTATPHRTMRQMFWEEYKCIAPPEDYSLPNTVYNVGLNRETDLAQLFDKFTFSSTIKDHFNREMHGPNWSVCIINGMRYVEAFQNPVVEYLRKQYPTATILHVAGKEYKLINGSQTTILSKIFTGKPPQSVQQAITDLYDHRHKEERDKLKLIVIGHCKIEEGQTHGNFKGDRFAKLQLLATTDTVADDSFAQYVRLEPEKAKKFGVSPIMLSDSIQWEDYQKSIDWIQKASRTLEKEGPDTELELPPTYVSNMKCRIGGALEEETLTEEQIQNLEFFTKSIKVDFPSTVNVDDIFNQERNKRNGSTITKRVKANLPYYVSNQPARLMYEEKYEERYMTPAKKWFGGAQIINLGGNTVAAIFPKDEYSMANSETLFEEKSFKINDPRLEEGYRLRLRRKNVRTSIRP